ncbi:hypothetical protein V5799_016222 [Amblyomma americanum]|uniref:Sulfotransferase domain-containing protein n=1 Tax=Amblyomma americanum TaxID=6943 RepID=A0AAQ4F6V3_AMBAM
MVHHHDRFFSLLSCIRRSLPLSSTRSVPSVQENLGGGLTSTMEPSDYMEICLVPMMTVFSEENVLSAMQYRPRVNDTVIATYPKCGTTWTQYIVSNILTRVNTPIKPGEYMLFSPLIELTGAEVADRLERKGPVITHLPLSNMVFSKQAKYIYVARNPYDCCVSCYYFFLGLTPKSTDDVSFGTFLEKFLAGKTLYGGFFEHLLPWYNLRDEPNVLFFTYEQLKSDTGLWILKIADFLGEEHGKALREDRDFYERVLQSSSLQAMKVVFNYTPFERIQSLGNLSQERSLRCLDFCQAFSAAAPEMHRGSAFVRSGKVGDWKVHFTPEQVEKTKAWIEEKTKGSDVMTLWKDLDIPH